MANQTDGLPSTQYTSSVNKKLRADATSAIKDSIRVNSLFDGEESFIIASPESMLPIRKVWISLKLESAAFLL
jgi:hypothetical protein